MCCLEHGIWTDVTIKAIHDNDTPGIVFSSDKIGGLRAASFNQAQTLQLNEMLMKVYFAWAGGVSSIDL